MTEQEAEVLAARLTRVWDVQEPVSVSTLPDKAGKEISCPKFVKEVSRGVRVGAQPLTLTYIGELVFYVTVLYEQEWERVLVCMLDSTNPVILNGSDASIPPEIAIKHLPFFRRGCWLSGAPIEASAHEKAQWVRGFSREEIEAWNLKM